jgi:hypothetical protein
MFLPNVRKHPPDYKLPISEISYLHDIWDITSCSPLKVNRRFGGTYRLHLQSRRISRARDQRESRWQAQEQSASRNFGLCLPPAFTLVSCSAYSSTLKLEAIYSSESSVDFQRTTRRYMPADGTLPNQRRENLKSYTLSS